MNLSVCAYNNAIRDSDYNDFRLDSSVVEYVLWVYVVLGSNPSSGRARNRFFASNLH